MFEAISGFQLSFDGFRADFFGVREAHALGRHVPGELCSRPLTLSREVQLSIPLSQSVVRDWLMEVFGLWMSNDCHGRCIPFAHVSTNRFPRDTGPLENVTTQGRKL